jgi:hypothetical protein
MAAEKKFFGSKKRILGIVIGVVLFVGILVGLWGVYQKFGAKGQEGSKKVVIEVVNGEGEESVYTVQTDSLYLIGAMEEADGLTFEGDESEYGLMIHTVNGERADSETGAYWSFYIGDEYCNYGADSQPIADGDEFSIVYTKL